MRGRNVQRFEVMPLIFDLGAHGHGEAEPAHDLFEFFDRLRQRMQPAQPFCSSGQGAIERLAIGRGAAAFFEPLFGGCEGSFDLALDLVEPLATGRLFSGRERAQALLRSLELAALGSQKINAGSFQRIATGGRGERGLRSDDQLVEFREKFSKSHLGLSAMGLGPATSPNVSHVGGDNRPAVVVKRPARLP